jgi:hypothetical protein
MIMHLMITLFGTEIRFHNGFYFLFEYYQFNRSNLIVYFKMIEEIVLLNLNHQKNALSCCVFILKRGS